jgi:hypothetical protein
VITVNVSSNIDQVVRDLRAKLGPQALAAKIRAGMRAAKPEVKTVMAQETRRAFKVVKPQFAERAWRVSTQDQALIVKSLAPWMGVHVTGGTIRPKGHRKLLIPINLITGRIGTRKFFRLVAEMQNAGLTVIKGGVLYVKPVWNTSRRGGVAAGTRINKRFRQRLSGSRKRPSGFSATWRDVGGERLIPIAVLKSSITMRQRLDLPAIARQRLVPIVVRHVQAELTK